MQIYRAKDYEEMSRIAAKIIAAQVVLNPSGVLGLATGSSPLGIYANLTRWHKKGDLDFSGMTSVNLDEYKGLAPDNEQSYNYFMHHNLFDHINIKKENVHLPNGLESDGEKECARYEAVIQRCGGVDLQLLGIGNNGHIGFNEPDAAFAKDTHCVKLTQSTIDANKRFFEKEEDVPRYAYTMGIRTILQARQILLIASGKGKAEIVKKAFSGPITPQVPASVLQFHGNVVLVGDEEALSLL